MKRILSVALALLLVFGILPVANAAALFDPNGQEQVLGSDGGDTVTPSNRDRKNGKLFEAAPEAEEPEATEIVPIIVEMEDEPALAVTKSVEAAAPVEAKLLEKQQVMQKDIESALGVNLDVKYNHTLVYNGFSFYGEYSLVERINNLNCGAYAYVAPQFESPKMTQSIGIIGGDVAWAEGFSGEGTTIAILDTGIRLNHEAFSVVPQSIELTQDELQARIDAAGSSFNAGTNLSQLYKSGKIPFAYNYYKQSYNPAHDSSAHGSHVAGIAAGNNGSNFKGVAPDAQLIVMHVFQPSGGAAWTEILSALEDCAYLGVDSANMSLGSSCGFTNYNGYGYEESFALLRQAGVNLSVAAGNDEDATVGNRWGSGRQIAYNPDYGVVGSPSTWPESLSVASSTKGSGTPLSGFSSRGTTSDLKIKPEILAPGSAIYSVNGNGSGYTNSSGTSMAAPHVAGGMAIVKQYVEQMFPNANEETKMELVDAILMSTAVPATYSNGNPYFVRDQGAGLMNLASSVHTTAYLSVEDCVRPKLEIGSSANGVFELNFTVNNFGDTELTYNLSATVLTETPYSGSFSGETKYYINGTPYVLNDLVNIDAPQTVTVPAGGTTDVSMTITLNDEAKAFFEEHFEAGMYVEGFVKLQGVEANGETPVNLGIPFLGFYGDWNYPAMIEVNANYYQDNPTYSQRYANIVGYKSGNTIQGLGINPYVDMTEAQFLADRGAVSPNNDGYYESINVLYANLMRNAVNIEYGVEFENGEYAVLTSADCIKKGNRPDGEWLMQQMGVDYMTFPTWKLGALADGESAVLKVIATLDNEGYTPEANANGIWDIPVTKDLTAPEIVDVEVISGGVRITFTDAHYVAYAEASAGSQTIAENGYFENERGVVSTMDVITSASEFTFFLGDYAANEAEYTINTATGDFDGGAVNPPGPPVEHDIDEALNVQGGELAFENHMLLPWITEEVGGRLYAKSDIAGVDNCTTSFSTTVNMVAGDELSFDWKVSSEADYDYLFFYANGEEVDKISGNRNWATYTWTAPSDGEYTFEWSYVKDPYTGEGSDCGYVDNVAVNSDTPPVTPTVPPVTPTPTPDVPGDLDEALNVEGGTLTFANDATYPWEVRDNYAVSGNAGVQSSTSTVTTTVELAEGEALFFDWSTSSEANYDKLIFSANGTAVRNISGIVDWTQFYYAAPAAGTYTFTWSYTKDSSVNGNNDEAYLDDVYVGEAPEVPEADMYAFNSFEESWITFNSADPSMAAPVGAPGATVFAAEYVDGTVYGYTNDGRFFTTTLSNMSNLNVVGTIGEVIVDMAYNYANDTMYAIGTSDNQAGPRSLHTVDLETGALTLVGSLEDTAVAAIMTLGITTEGEAYGISFAPGNQTNDSYLHTINLETAECEAIGPTGFPINYVQTMAYDHNNDQMLWAQFYSDGMFTQTSALVAVNLETGAGTQLGSTPVGGEVGELLGMFSVPGDEPPVTPTPTPVIPGDLDEALNVEGGTLTFTNDEVYPWEVRDNYAVSGNAGVQGSTSTVTTTVELAEGEALYFDWSISSERSWDKLIFSVNGTAVRNISGIEDWTQFRYIAPGAGTYTFSWSYTKDDSVDQNNDEAYLDEVYVGEAPVIEDPNLYAYSVFTNSWITFNSEDPANTTPVGAPETPIFAAEYVDGTVYGYTENGSFFTTDLNNMGALNILGNFGELVVDMAYNYANETMYAIGTSENQEGPRSLYTVNLETGELTLVGALEGAVDTIMTLGITTEGEAYGVSIGVDTFLHTINLETAECEAKDLVTGFPLNYIQTMTYDHNNDRMIWAQYSDDSSNGLVELNLGTGIGTRISGGPVGGQESELTGLFTIPGEGPTPPPPGDYTIEAGTVEANPGSTVRVPVTVNGLAAAAFELSYDADMFTYVGYTNPVSDALVTVNDLVAGELTIAMMNYEANYEGEAIILEFAVAGDCEDGEYAIPVEVISAAAIIDGATTGIDASEVDAIAGAINVVNGYTVTFMYNGEIIAEVTVPVGGAAEAPEMDRYIYDEESGYYHVFCGWDKDFSSVYENMTVNAIYGILGDVNNDGTVNITDATMLMRGVVGMEALSELQEILADVNCDGSVGISDATLIARFVTGLETFPVPMD